MEDVGLSLGFNISWTKSENCIAINIYFYTVTIHLGIII